MRLAAMLLAGALALGVVQPVLAKGSDELRFLGLHPHGPLARVTRGKVESPETGACRSWGKRGGVWSALDRFGRVVGEARISGLDRYDVTNCDELSLTRQRGKAGVGLFVSKSYQALPIAAWRPTQRAERALRKLTARRDKPLAKKHDVAVKLLPSGTGTLFFRTPDGARRAAVGGRALSVYRFEQGAWRREHVLPPQGGGDHTETFLIAGVLDMNSDGAPELVIHWAAIDGYQDLTLSLSKGERRWRLIEPGIHGAYAGLKRALDALFASGHAEQPARG